MSKRAEDFVWERLAQRLPSSPSAADESPQRARDEQLSQLRALLRLFPTAAAPAEGAATLRPGLEPPAWLQQREVGVGFFSGHLQVHHDATRDTLLGWDWVELASGSHAALPLDELRALAHAAHPPPAGAELLSEGIIGEGADEIYQLRYRHLEGDVVVEGDQLLIKINAATGTVYSVWCKWRTPTAAGPQAG